MNKVIIKVVIIVFSIPILGYIGFQLLYLRYNNDVKLIYSPDKRHCISQFNFIDEQGGNFTVFTYGKVKSNKLPHSYIKVRNKWNDAWYGLVKWNGPEAIFFYTYYDFEAINLEKSLLKMDFMQSDQEFSSYFFDKIPNDYIKVSSIPEYNTQQ